MEDKRPVYTEEQLAELSKDQQLKTMKENSRHEKGL